MDWKDRILFRHRHTCCESSVCFSISALSRLNFCSRSAPTHWPMASLSVFVCSSSFSELHRPSTSACCSSCLPPDTVTLSHSFARLCSICARRSESASDTIAGSCWGHSNFNSAVLKLYKQKLHTWSIYLPESLSLIWWFQVQPQWVHLVVRDQVEHQRLYLWTSLQLHSL